MSLRDKYNKNKVEAPHQTAAAALLKSEAEKQKNVNTEIQNVKKATFVLDAVLHTRLKTQAAIEGRNMAEIVTEALEVYLNGK